MSLVSLAGLTACGSIESEFIKALNASRDTELCVPAGDLGVKLWRVDGRYYLVEQEKSGITGDKSDVQALGRLQKAGYVARDHFTFDGHDGWGFPQRNLVGYEISSKGSKHFKWEEKVCLGEKRATKVVEYTEPSQQTGMVMTTVKFKYDVDFNGFVKDVGIEKDLRRSWADSSRDGEGDAVFVKTNKGWRLEYASW
jgi:hypothetical protein